MGDLYEVQVFKDQVWRVDSVFDDKELAIEAARRIGEGGRQSARVIEERTDPGTGRAALRAVFRISKANPAGERLNAAQPGVTDVETRVQSYVSEMRRRKRPIGLFRIVLSALLGAALIGAGYVAIYFVRDYLNTLMP